MPVHLDVRHVVKLFATGAAANRRNLESGETGGVGSLASAKKSAMRPLHAPTRDTARPLRYVHPCLRDRLGTT
jgi:hypothetical protein